MYMFYIQPQMLYGSPVGRADKGSAELFVGQGVLVGHRLTINRGMPGSEVP